MKYLLISIYCWIFYVIASMLLLPVAVAIRLVTYKNDKSLSRLHRFTAFWGLVFIWGTPLWKFKIEGEENIQTDENYVMISNHQSMIDIFILYQIKHQFKWVAKASLFKTPFFGQALALNNYIKLERTNRSSMLKMMRHANRVLRDYCSVMIFPEGTRSMTGEMGNFKDGAFKLALESGKRILPIVLDRTVNSLPKKGIVLNKTEPFIVKVLPPVDTVGVDQKELLQKCRQLMLDELEQIRLNS